jgi:hypothetical protein
MIHGPLPEPKLHTAVAVVEAVRLGVAVVETAAVVEVLAVEDGVHALGLVAGRDAVGGVVAVAATRRDEDAVRRAAAEGDRCRDRVRQTVESAGRRALESAGRRLGEVVTPSRLVVDDGDQAARVGAE